MKWCTQLLKNVSLVALVNQNARLTLSAKVIPSIQLIPIPVSSAKGIMIQLIARKSARWTPAFAHNKNHVDMPLVQMNRGRNIFLSGKDSGNEALR